MRGWAIVAFACLCACGRIGFDATDATLVADTPGDGTIVLPRTELYLKASNTNASDLFGASVGVSGDGSLLAVGAYDEASSAIGLNGTQGDNSRPGAGAVYLFTHSGSTWTQSQYIKSSNTDINDQFGFAVAMSRDGHTFAVTAPLEASSSTGINGVQIANNFPAAGAVYVFSDAAGSSWFQEAYIKASNTDGGDQFGYSIAISADGNTLAVGARQEDSGTTGVGAVQTDNTQMDAGAVYVFTRSGTTWSQQVYIKPSTARAGNEFGRSVAISDDGNTLVAAATYDKSNTVGVDGDDTNTLASAAGGVYVFTRSGTTWKQANYLKASNTQAGDSFGWNVAISGDASTIAVSTIGESSKATGINGSQSDESAQDAGAVYMFARAGTTWIQEAYIKASNTDTNDHFGWATVLTRDGNGLVVAATGEASNATGIDGNQGNNSAVAAGAAYVYTRSAGQWTGRAYLKATNTDAQDDFGKGLAVTSSGDMIVIGASSEDSPDTGVGGAGTSNSASSSGAAYVFQ